MGIGKGWQKQGSGVVGWLGTEMQKAILFWIAQMQIGSKKLAPRTRKLRPISICDKTW